MTKKALLCVKNGLILALEKWHKISLET